MEDSDNQELGKITPALQVAIMDCLDVLTDQLKVYLHATITCAQNEIHEIDRTSNPSLVEDKGLYDNPGEIGEGSLEKNVAAVKELRQLISMLKDISSLEGEEKPPESVKKQLVKIFNYSNEFKTQAAFGAAKEFVKNNKQEFLENYKLLGGQSLQADVDARNRELREYRELRVNNMQR